MFNLNVSTAAVFFPVDRTSCFLCSILYLLNILFNFIHFLYNKQIQFIIIIFNIHILWVPPQCLKVTAFLSESM